MDDKIAACVKLLGIGQPISDRIKELYRWCKMIMSEGIDDLFVSEVPNEAGGRDYHTLHFFSTRIVYEFESFVSSPSLWIAGLRGTYNCRFESKDFDYVSASDKSRLYVLVQWSDGFALHLRASGENCMHLLTILQKYIIPGIGR